MKDSSVFLLFVCISCFVGCAQKQQEELTIPEDKLVTILMDAHILESALQDVSTRKRDSVKAVFYKQLYEIHEISEEKFIENITILEDQPKMLSEVYSKVMEEVSKLEAEEKEKENENERDGKKGGERN